MVSTRFRSAAPVALVLTVLLALGAFTAPAEAAIKRTMALRVSAAIVGQGASVTFAGALTNTPVGSSLKLQIKAGDDWLDARSLKTTTADGAFKAVVVMPTYLGKYYFRAFAPSGGGRTSATSNTVSVTVLKKVSAVITPNRTTVSEGELVTFNGKVSPCVVGSTVTLQRYTGASWVTVTTATLSSKCTFVRAVRPTATTSYRLSVPRHGNLAPTYSAVKKITFDGPAPTPPVVTTTSLPDGSVGTAYDQTLTKTGGTGTWTKPSGSLPNGLTLTGSTGKISGTPTTGGTFNFTVRFTETGSGLAASKALSITVAAGPVITTTSLPDGKRGDAYAAQLEKTGADGTWSALHLPSGVTIDSSTGAITGTPIVEGDFTVAAKFTETVSGKVANKSLALHIETSPPPVITTTTLPDGVKNTAYTTTLTKTGNAGTWAVTGGSLPAGITLNATTGELSGTSATSDDWSFTVTFTETAAQTKDTQAYVLHMSPAANSPAITTANLLPNGTVGAAYSQQLEADNGLGLSPWSISKGALPTGLTLNGANGTISGTPTLSGTFTFQVKYSLVTGSNTKLFTITVKAAP